MLSYVELTIGVQASSNVTIFRHRSARLNALRKAFGQGAPFDEDCLRAYERILAHVADAGGDVKARRFGRLIAATALAHDATLVTRNDVHVINLTPLIEIDVR